MDWDKRSLRVGALILAGAILIRLLCMLPPVQALEPEDILSVVLFMEAGRVVKRPQELPATEPTWETGAADVRDDPQLPANFSGADLSLLEINNLTGFPIDPEALLQQDLTWDLTQEGPAVLILHTHATESYRNTDGYVETARFRTLDESYNVVSIGTEVARILEAGGVQVLHDTTAHDSPSYSDAYSNARQTIRDYLEQYPSIRLVLDIHRDAAQNAAGEQVAYTSELGGQSAAQLMLVCGSDAGGLDYPNWEQNLSVAVKLQTALQRSAPGLCRPLNLRAQRYNQDLHPASVLVEVGAAGNSHDEAILAARALAEGILSIAHGTHYQQSAVLPGNDSTE